MTCTIDGCARIAAGRGLCGMHYKSEYRAGRLAAHDRITDWVNPLVCVCEKPVADPSRDFGMCQVCKRKPLALMAVPA